MIELSDFEIIDVHIHPPGKGTLKETYARQTPRFVDYLIPNYKSADRDALRDSLMKEFSEGLQYGSPRVRGLLNYASRVYGCKPTVEDLDLIMTSKVDPDFRKYLESVLNREKISHVILDTTKVTDRPVATIGDLPPKRTKWTFNIVPRIQPVWAEKNNFRSIGDAITMADELVREAVSNGCCGFKNSMAYFRPLDLSDVSEDEADAALKWLMNNKPSSLLPDYPFNRCIYPGPEGESMLRKYQDFLLKEIYTRAGKSDLRIFIHIAAALNPTHSQSFNDPISLYSILKNEEIIAARTKFIILHAGYPHFHKLSSILTQFPHVYCDVSFFSQFPGILEEVLRVFLQLAPAHKIMHGSDSNLLPEVTAYSAYNMKRILTTVLRDFQEKYEWTEDQCISTAKMVLSENAKRLFNIA